MAYTPDWEPLAAALKRVMATGASEDEAKAELCCAVADRKINVRVRIAATAYAPRARVFSGGNVGVPPHLRPSDLDWAHSRPLARWPIGPTPGQHYFWIGGWQDQPLDLVELSTAGVIETLCGQAEGELSSSVGKLEPAKPDSRVFQDNLVSKLKRRRVDHNGYPLSDDQQFISQAELEELVDTESARQVVQWCGALGKGALASELLSLLSERRWLPCPSGAVPSSSIQRSRDVETEGDRGETFDASLARSKAIKKRGGRPEDWDYEGLIPELGELASKRGAPIAGPELVGWVADNVKPKPGRKPRAEVPDQHTIKEAIKRHQLDRIRSAK